MKIKKLFCTLLIGILLMGSLSGSTSAYNVGDVIGSVLSTDIVTYIDGIRVPSFNIAGRTAVIAENLNACGVGYHVSYSETDRVLTVSTSGDLSNQRDFFHFDADTSSQPVGTPIMNVLYSDIKTFVNGTETESFNIGGYTCIYTDDLAKYCGTYLWDDSARTVNIHTTGKLSVPTVSKTDSYHVLPAAESVITKDETFDRWGETAKSHIIKNDDGTYLAVEIDEHINIETYDSQFNHLSSFAIKKELPIFGTLYLGKDFNYIAFGQENLLDDNSREVIKIVIYDKNFVKVSEVSVNNCKTAIPFASSNAQMYEDERYLVLHTSRSQYRDENGNRPQTQLTVIVDKHTWQVSNMLGKFQYNHTSHALNQFVKIDNGRLITANYSDAAPLRGAFLQELGFDGKVIHTQGIFNVGGPAGANCTGAMIGGLEVSSSGYLVSMSTIDHSLPTGYSNLNIEGIDRENRDIYLLWADKNTWQLRHTCLARYTGAGLTGSTPYLIKLEDGNFMVLWQQFTDYSDDSNTICYAYIDSDGNQIGETFSAQGQLSESCQPIAADGKVIWYVNDFSGRSFYSIDINPDSVQKSENPPVVPEAAEKEDVPSEESIPDKKEEAFLEEEENRKDSVEVDGI